MSENINHIFYINLEKRTDRREQIEFELKNYGLSFERFNAIYNPNNGIGCAYSHLEIIKIAKERGYKNIIIFEDDFKFEIPKIELENILTLFFNSKIDYDVCMLSYNLSSYEKTKYDYLNRVKYAQTASGYLINGLYYDKLIKLYEWSFNMLEKTGEHWNYANDVVWKQLQEIDNWYCFTPRIGIQRESYSDLAGRVVNYHC